ncbi:MAG TPA: sigma-70 family RNA polymerase sigma factor [Pirellulales bacterium]
MASIGPDRALFTIRNMASSLSASHEWIESCQGLVKSLALKIHRNLPRQLELDDLISYGQVGLAEAARDFDPTRGGQFSTFAYYRIRGAIYDGLSKMSWTKRSHYQKLKYEQMSNEVLRLQNESDPLAPQATAEDDVRWLAGVSRALAVVYLSSQLASEQEPFDCEDDSQRSPPQEAMDREMREKLRSLVEQLPEEARTIIQATYFEGLTLTEAGQRLGIGKAWASRLHSKTLERLARTLRSEGLGD